MIEKHKQKSKKPATVSRATEESKTESDQAKGKLVALPGDCSPIPFSMNQISKGQMPFIFAPWMIGNMQEIIDKIVYALLSK